MTDLEQTTEGHSTLIETQSIGQLLQKKRQSLQIEIREVCAYLKVKSADIAALENDDLESVAKHIYVLGLIRSYAKFLKIAPQIIEDQIKVLPIASNTENKKHLLINIGEEQGATPNKDSFFNFLLISVLLFLVLLSLYNSFENNDNLITNKSLVHELENIDS